MSRGIQPKEHPGALYQIFEKIGALREKIEAVASAKSDRVEFEELRALVDTVDRVKADRQELQHLKDALSADFRAELQNTAEKLGDRINHLNSAILDVGDKAQSSLGEAAKMRELFEDLSGTLSDFNVQLIAIRETAEAEAAERSAKRKRAVSLVVVGIYRGFAVLAFVIILVVQGVTGLPQALAALRVAVGF